MSESEDEDNFGAFNFGDILTELQINSDAEEDDEEDAFNQEEEDERVEETGWDDESVRFYTDEEFEIFKAEIASGKQGASQSLLRFPPLVFYQLDRPDSSHFIPSSLPPKPNIIPEQFLSNPKLLLDKVYGINRVFGPVLDVTNKRLLEKYPNEPPFTMNDFEIGIGMLLFASLKRSRNEGMDEFWQYAVKNDRNLGRHFLTLVNST